MAFESEHQRARRETVAERAADEHEDRARDGRRHQDGAQRQAGAGELERQPGKGDEVELVAEDADRLAGEEEAEVADAQRPQQGGAGLGGSAVRWSPTATVGDSSLVAMRHSTLISTPSPSGSSTSMIGPIVAGFDRVADAVGLVAAEARHEAERRVDEADRDAQVDDLPAALVDPDAQLATARPIDALPARGSSARSICRCARATCRSTRAAWRPSHSDSYGSGSGSSARLAPRGSARR